MSIWGKIIGGVAGFAVGGPLGALIGAGAGHVYDKAKAEGDPLMGGAQSKQVAFTVAVVALSAKMAKADGHVSRAEIDAFKGLFNIPPSEMHKVGRLFDEAKQSTQGFELYADQISIMFKDSPQVLEALLDALFTIAMADGVMHPNEVAFLKKVAVIFRMPDKEFDRARAEAEPPSRSDPYAALGVTREMSDKEIKAAYRNLTKEHHPDVLMAKGMPEEFIEVANQKMAHINAAYDRIKKERGLS